jgi:hypothetical protein
MINELHKQQSVEYQQQIDKLLVNILYSLLFPILLTTVSHIPQFGDAASPARDVNVSAGDAHL